MSDTWTVNLTVRGHPTVGCVCLPSDPAIVLAEHVMDVVEGLSSETVKLVCKGKSLDLSAALDGQRGMKDGAKVMLVASSKAAVDALRILKPDPTVRGLEDEARREAARRGSAAGSASSKSSSSSAWQSDQDSQHRFHKLEAVRFDAAPLKSNSPHPFEAEALLSKLATDPGIVAVMRAHGWNVGALKEMDPNDPQTVKLVQSGGCLLGYNENAGARIYLRLRTDDLSAFRPYRQVINTLLHELAHNEIGPHLEPFWALFAVLKAEYLRAHAALQRSGVLVGGAASSSMADLREGEAQNIDGELGKQLAQEAANGAVRPEERAAAARVAAAAAGLQGSGSAGSGGPGTLPLSRPLDAHCHSSRRTVCLSQLTGGHVLPQGSIGLAAASTVGGGGGSAAALSAEEMRAARLLRLQPQQPQPQHESMASGDAGAAGCGCECGSCGSPDEK